MKTLKFKAWDKNKREFIKGFAINENGLLMIMEGQGEWVDQAKYGIENVILLQDTGIDDKNGEDIFKGDIINCSFQLKDNEPELFKGVEVEFDMTWGATISPFDVYSLGRCRDCGKLGVNRFVECSCSYEVAEVPLHIEILLDIRDLLNKE